MKKVSIYFKIKGNNGNIHNSANYSISELIKMTEEDIFENMEVCNCSLNESSNHCEGDCVKFDSGEIVGYEIVFESAQPSAPSVSAEEIEMAVKKLAKKSTAPDKELLVEVINKIDYQ